MARPVRTATKTDTEKSVISRLRGQHYLPQTLRRIWRGATGATQNGATGANDIYSRTPFDQHWSCLDFGFFSVRNHVEGLSLENGKIQSRRYSRTSHRGSQKGRHASQNHRRGSHKHLFVTKDRSGSQKRQLVQFCDPPVAEVHKNIGVGHKISCG